MGAGILYAQPMTFWGYATWSRKPTWFSPYQMRFPACRLEITDEHVSFGAPPWARILTIGLSIPKFDAKLGDIAGFAQDGCTVRLRFRDRAPLWFCPQFGGTITTLLSLLYAAHIAYEKAEARPFMGFCSGWVLLTIPEETHIPHVSAIPCVISPRIPHVSAISCGIRDA